MNCMISHLRMRAIRNARYSSVERWLLARKEKNLFVGNINYLTSPSPSTSSKAFVPRKLYNHTVDFILSNRYVCTFPIRFLTTFVTIEDHSSTSIDATTISNEAHVIYDTVETLQALVASKSPQIRHEADALLQKLEDQRIDPSFECLYWALECWSQTKHKGAEERIEELYHALWKCYEESANTVHHPEVQESRKKQLQEARLRVLKAYHHAANAHRAEELLLQFADHSHSNRQSTLPTTMEMCKSVLMTWARSNSKRRAMRAEKLLSLMNKDPMLQDPDIACYTMVLNCWSSSEKENAPRRAELLLRSMEFQNDDTVRPNLVSYTCVLNAWARSKDPNAPEEAERLLSEIQNDKGWEVDRVVYTAMISVWGRSARPNTIDKSEEYLRELLDKEASSSATKDEKTNGVGIKATVVEYTALIQAWADHVKKHVKDSRRAVDRVDELLEELLERYFSTNFDGNPDAGLWRPNRLTFASVLRTVSAALRIPNREDRAMDILRKMEKLNMEPDTHILWLVDKCSRNSSKNDKGKRRKNT